MAVLPHGRCQQSFHLLVAEVALLHSMDLREAYNIGNRLISKGDLYLNPVLN